MVAACDVASKAGLRDRALLVLALAGAFRRSELVALDVADVEQTPDGLLILLRRSETDQEARGKRKPLPYGSNPATCPVRT
jgi:site-specific recombinase XerD